MKKHKILIVALIAYFLVGVISPDKLLMALGQSKHYFIEMLQILPAVFILTSLIQTWIPTKVIMKYFGDGSGIKGTLISFLIGSLSAGPIYAAFPVCQTLLQKGAGIKNILIILSAWAVVKVPMLINEAKFMGLTYMGFRWLLTLIAILVMSTIINKLVKIEDLKLSSIRGINHSACIMCGKCLKTYPDLIVLKNGRLELISKDYQPLVDICPLGAIK